MSYNLETRVERLERQLPDDPYELMTDEELRARLDYLNRQFLERFGATPRGVKETELLYQASLRGDAEFTAAVEQLKVKQAAEAERAAT